MAQVVTNTELSQQMSIYFLASVAINIFWLFLIFILILVRTRRKLS